MSQSAEVARRVIKACYSALRSEGVSLNATLLKPMMVLPGLTHPNRESVTPEAVARATLDCMRASVPGEVPGILFLSGGLSETEVCFSSPCLSPPPSPHPSLTTAHLQATRYLCAINRLADAEAVPWTLSFSFGRALQSSAMKVWGGRPENVDAGRTVAAALARVNAEAQLGKYSGSSHPSLMEDTPLYEGFRGHRSGEDPVGA
jgi:fructose-bisphosphate aldolase, class I